VQRFCYIVGVSAASRAMTVAEVAKRLAVDPRTVRAEVERGRLAAFRVGTVWRITPASLDEYMRPPAAKGEPAPAPSGSAQRLRRARPAMPLRSFRARARDSVVAQVRGV
jgi:excisionase family DNA binding protein